MAMKRVSMLLLGIVTIASLGGGAPPAQANGEEPRLIPRSLSYRDIGLYGMPSTVWASGGLWTVGKGETIYLETQALVGTVVTGVDWTLTSAPPSSTATIGADVLPAALGFITPGDAAAYIIAGRATLIPDVEGQYGIQAVIHTTTKGDITLTASATAASYVGVGRELDAAGNTVAKNAQWPQCALCHAVTDKIDEWQKTGHATKLVREISGLGSDHYSGSCVKCHSVGYNSTLSANNGGFDDVAKSLSWTFPVDGAGHAILAPASWADMPPALKNVSNIQCENCHGAGNQHKGDPEQISVAQDVGVCGQCHDQPASHSRVAEWRLSGHAKAPTSPTGPGRESCAQCHSTTGFIDYAEGKPEAERRTDYAGITCSTCHDPHSDANDRQLRTLADVTLKNGEVITEGADGKLCMNCHMSRVNVETYVATTAGSSRFGPHHGPQTDMIAGTNAFEYGKFIPSTGHLVAVGELCVECHMQNLKGNAAAVPPIPEDPSYTFYKTNPVSAERYMHVGGHTWKMAWDKNATPDDVTDDIDVPRVCSECHGAVASFDKLTRKDFDGNGIAEGVQTEIENLLEELGMLLPPIGQPTVTITSAYTKQQLKAAFNYKFVEEDRSKGVHNAAYAAGILKASIEDLKGSAADPLLGGASVGNGWYLSPIYGYYYKLMDNWIFHENHGLLNVSTDKVSGYVFMWDPVIGTWMSTNDTMYPLFYFYDGQGVMWFTHNDQGDRYFYRLTDAQWIYYPGFNLNPTNMNP